MAEPSDLAGWLERLERRHPREIDLGLGRVGAVADRLGLRPFPAPVLTVAGTNGKGTVTYCAAALAAASGRRVGAYTSPHLLRYNERIAVDGTPVEDGAIVRAFEAIEAARGDISLSYFETATLAALWLFREARVELAVLEVGLGGRLDATNILDADVAVVTRIGLDHREWLGDTVEAIAIEKAGSTDGTAVRDGFYAIDSYAGLIKNYSTPFTPEQHDALGPQDYVFTHFVDGSIVPVKP